MSAHVLLIEDDGALRLEMLDYLIRHHMRVTACGTLAEAKEALVPGANTFGRPDVVVADISLPDGDGASFYVENAKRFPEAKWILMSGNHDLVRLASQLKENADLPVCAVVDKPLPLRLMARFIDGAD